MIGIHEFSRFVSKIVADATRRKKFLTDAFLKPKEIKKVNYMIFELKTFNLKE